MEETNKNADTDNNPGGDDPVALQQYLSRKPFAECTEWERAFRMRYLDLMQPGVVPAVAARAAYLHTTNALGIRPHSPAEVDKLRHQLWEAESRCKVLAEKVEDWERRYKAADQANASEVQTLRKDVALLKQDIVDKEAEHEQDRVKLAGLLGVSAGASWSSVFNAAGEARRALQAQNHHEQEQQRKLEAALRMGHDAKPGLGALVLYVDATGEVRPAIVTGLHNERELSVSLVAFMRDGRTVGIEEVPAYAPGSYPRQCWRWRP